MVTKELKTTINKASSKFLTWGLENVRHSHSVIKLDSLMDVFWTKIRMVENGISEQRQYHALYY